MDTVKVWICAVPAEWTVDGETMWAHSNDMFRGLFVPAHLRRENWLFLVVSQKVCMVSGIRVFQVVYCPVEVAERAIRRTIGCKDCRMDAMTNLDNLMTSHARSTKVTNYLPMFIIAQFTSSGMHDIPFNL